ncbi:hypothetical protein [Paraburkholderia caribensis]|uniref:oxidoreductase n=1 Tax=Paraburkholderia caribensis TaxID=75105 RepID=UPI001F467050|nr:hypothetical protein [Paraburkholderia caribensis]
MTDAEIDAAIRGFVTAARRAVTLAEFSGVEIHGAKGYLLDQFLAAETDHRTDHEGACTTACRRCECGQARNRRPPAYRHSDSAR